MEKEKDKDTSRLNFYLWGPQPFHVVEYFPGPVEIAMLPESRYLKKIMESSWPNCKFEGHHMSVFNGYVQQRLLLAGDTTHCLIYPLWVCAFLPVAERKRCIHLSWGSKSFREKVPLWIQEAYLFRHAQIVPPGKLLLLHLFVFYVIAYSIPTDCLHL